MKLASIKNESPDGQLVVVSRDLSRMVPASRIAATMQEALENWDRVEPALEALFEALQRGEAGEARPFDAAAALAPLPRAWQWLDGSAFQSHGDLMSTVFGMEKLPYDQRPLMYQGLSDRFLAPSEDAFFPSETDGIDFEGEFGIITDRVPLGVDELAARAHIKLIVLINDWSLRAIAPIEMKTGFGWIQAKPASAIAPVAVTPSELEGQWRDCRVHLDLNVAWNGERFGAANGGAMAFGFDQLIAHAARTRNLVAGTVIGSGTVSNETYREVGSSCIAEKRGIEILDQGAARTSFMHFGDTVRMEARLPGGSSVFGAIDQRVVKA